MKMYIRRTIIPTINHNNNNNTIFYIIYILLVGILCFKNTVKILARSNFYHISIRLWRVFEQFPHLQNMM